MKKRLLSFLLSFVLISSFPISTAALDLEDAKQLLKEHYIDTIPDIVMEQETLEDLLGTLGDSYTEYLTKEQYNSFLELVNGESIVGVGISVRTAYTDGFEVAAVLDNSPAQEANWAPGDHIVAVDGIPATKESDIRAMISGPEGTTVTISLRRASTGQVEEFTLTRRRVVIPIVTHEKQGSTGYINCTSFGDSTAQDIKKAILAMDDDVSSWIIDLRSNAGGLAQTAVGSASHFTGGGIMTYLRFANGKYQYYYVNPKYTGLTDKPLIILLSSDSASASELFSGAIRDYNAGIAIGDRSFGKGIAQHMMDNTSHPELFDGDAMKITTSRFFSPLRTTNHIIGILPTLLVSADYAKDVASLLSCDAPESPSGYVKLELAGYTFYIHLATAKSPQYKAAFRELLEALPPAAKLYYSFNSLKWEETTPQVVAAVSFLEFTPRTYSDLKNSVYADQINTLAAYQLLPGYTQPVFRPATTMTRGEFCSLIARALEFPFNPDAPAFSDVSTSSPYYYDISAMVTRGFISGYEDGTFHPEAEITYEAALCVLWRVTEWINMDAMDLSEEVPSIGEWLDYHEFSDWAENPAWRLEQMGITARLAAPTDPVTREVAAAMLYDLLTCTNILWN